MSPFPKWPFKIQRKCGNNFRLLSRRFWQNPSKNKRYNAPHLNSMWGMRKELHSHIAIQEIGVVRLSFCFVKLSDFLQRTAKTLSICLLHGKIPPNTTKLKRISETNNTLGAIASKKIIKKRSECQYVRQWNSRVGQTKSTTRKRIELWLNIVSTTILIER